MKLISYTTSAGTSYGILRGEEIVDLRRRLGDAHPTLRTTLADWQSLERFAGEPADHMLRDVALLPPVPDAGRIICVGLNYKSHIAETGRDTPSHPMLFTRYPDSIVASGDALVRPKGSRKFDFEGELAFVIGSGGRHIAAIDALNHVAGFACFNDGSLRDFQRHTSQFFPGKSFWRSGSFGPWLVTPDEVGDIGPLTLLTRLNGVEMQRATLDDLLFGVGDLVAYLSTILPLNAGDVVATGTTGGVGFFRDPPLWMKPGDVVEVEIEHLGTLRNSVIDESSGIDDPS